MPQSGKEEKSSGTVKRGRPRIHTDPIAVPIVFERETIEEIKKLGEPVAEFIREATRLRLAGLKR
jgi:hypothetical protein